MGKPLLLATASGHWECITCIETYNGASDAPYETEDRSCRVCASCIKDIFRQALELDYYWPPRWGPDELHYSDYLEVFDPDQHTAAERFATRYSEIAKRVQVTLSQESQEDVPDGYVKGLDYQRCPKCANMVSLDQGCNHISCFCGEQWCYVCGKPARDDGSGHWKPGGCPRYGTVASGDADYDEEDDDDDEEYEEDEVESTAFASWLWNTAVQAGDQLSSIQYMMTRSPQQRLEERTFRLITAREAIISWNAHPEYYQHEWDRLIFMRGPEINRFISGVEDYGIGMAWPDPSDHDFISHGVLYRPVGGVFNLLYPRERQAAWNWALDRLDIMRDGDFDEPGDYAVFCVGTEGGTFAERGAARYLLEELRNRTLAPTGGRLTVESMQGDALLVHVTGQEHRSSTNQEVLFDDGLGDPFLAHSFQELLLDIDAFASFARWWLDDGDN